MELGNLFRRKQSPGLISQYALHEKVWHPVCDVHVMRSSSLIPCVLPQLEEILNIKVPCFKIGACCTPSFSAPVDCRGNIICDFQERYYSLAFDIGALYS